MSRSWADPGVLPGVGEWPDDDDDDDGDDDDDDDDDEGACHPGPGHQDLHMGEH